MEAAPGFEPGNNGFAELKEVIRITRCIGASYWYNSDL
jgi:hypothetical protein